MKILNRFCEDGGNFIKIIRKFEDICIFFQINLRHLSKGFSDGVFDQCQVS